MRKLALENHSQTWGDTFSGMRNEGRRRLVLMALLFVVIAAAALVIGWNWPKNYHAAATILVSEDKIIQKLMEGRAVPTGVTEPAMIAREMIFSRAVMDDVLALGGWLDDAPSAAERELRADVIEARTNLSAPRANLIRIEYTDTQPQRAADVTQFFVDRFLADSHAMQIRESSQAYDFILGQVDSYAAQLAAAEAGLDAWRAAHPEVRMEPTAVIESRIALLRRRAETDQISLQELARGDRTSGIATIAADPLSLRIAAAEEELLGQQLQHTDAHPDTQRLGRQLAELRQRHALAPKLNARPAGAASASHALALGARITATEQEIAQEIEHVVSASNPTPEYAQLARERDVARDLYQELLRRLEYARLSVRLDEQGSGLGFQIQEHASVPTQATGMRFAHFVGGGLVAAAVAPLALLLLFVRGDPRLRSATLLRQRTGLPVIATVPAYWNAGDEARLGYQRKIALWAVALTLVVAATASLLKLTGVA